MRVLVTGGAGFIGSHVVDRLVGDGHEVVVLDLRLPSRLPSGVDHRRADVRDPEAWLACLRDVDAVCHQAAVVGSGAFGDVRELVAGNDGGIAAGLWAMHRIGFTGRLVVTSTTAVEVEPLSVYAATKLHQEQLALAFGREHGVQVDVLRLPPVVGDGMYLDSPDLTAPGEPVPVDDAAAVIVRALTAAPARV